MDAIDRQLGAQGLGGGIERGEKRTARADIGREFGSRMSAITQAELLADERAAEAEKGREWATGERESSQDFISTENALGRDQADRLEEGRLGLGYAGLMESGRVADMANELQRYGIDESTAYNYAALDQAKMLADRGMGFQQAALDLQAAGMTQQQSQFYASMAHSEKMFGKSMYADVFKAGLVSFFETVDVESPEYQNFINEMGAMFDIPDIGSIPGTQNFPETGGITPNSPGFSISDLLPWNWGG